MSDESTRVYSVPGANCGHCSAAITDELTAVEGVASVDVDLEKKIVTVGGEQLEDAALRAAINDAGYEVSEAA